MPVETGELLINNSHENNFSCGDTDRVVFDELGLTHPFTLPQHTVAILRNFTDQFLPGEGIHLDMVYGPGLGTEFIELISPGLTAPVVTTRNIKFIIVPGRYRLRYVGTRDPSELIVTFNSYPHMNIDYTQLALN